MLGYEFGYCCLFVYFEIFFSSWLGMFFFNGIFGRGIIYWIDELLFVWDCILEGLWNDGRSFECLGWGNKIKIWKYYNNEFYVKEIIVDCINGVFFFDSLKLIKFFDEFGWCY